MSVDHITRYLVMICPNNKQNTANSAQKKTADDASGLIFDCLAFVENAANESLRLSEHQNRP